MVSVGKNSLHLFLIHCQQFIKVAILKDVPPHTILRNFRFLTKNDIRHIIMTSSKVLLSAQFIIYDGQFKEIYKKRGRSGPKFPPKGEYWIHPAIIVN